MSHAYEGQALMVKKRIIASLASLVLISSAVVAVPATAASNDYPYPGRAAGLPCPSGDTGCVYDPDAGKWLLRDECKPDDKGCHYDTDIGLWLKRHRDVGLWLTSGAIVGVLLANVLNMRGQDQNQPASP